MNICSSEALDPDKTLICRSFAVERSSCSACFPCRPTRDFRGLWKGPRPTLQNICQLPPLARKAWPSPPDPSASLSPGLEAGPSPLKVFLRGFCHICSCVIRSAFLHDCQPTWPHQPLRFSVYNPCHHTFHGSWLL